MKKTIIILAVVIMNFSLFGCSSADDGHETAASSTEIVDDYSAEKEDEEVTLAEDAGQDKTEVNKEEQTMIRQFDFETKTVTLNSGYEMPINGLGTYSLLNQECVDSVTTALDEGVRLIDTAYMYHNEAEVGKAVRESDIPREEIFVTTKLYPNQYVDAANAIDEALDKLDIEYIDLLLLHHPGTNDVEAYKAMEQFVLLDCRTGI